MNEQDQETEPHTIKTDTSTIVFNGGKPLKGCPPVNEAGWKWAHSWEALANGDADEWSVAWKFDCGFKLDYDGPVVSISSRFYPPKEGYGPTWDGHVGVHIGDDKVSDKAFDCPTLEELRAEVELYVHGVTKKIEAAVRDAVKECR